MSWVQIKISVTIAKLSLSENIFEVIKKISGNERIAGPSLAFTSNLLSDKVAIVSLSIRQIHRLCRFVNDPSISMEKCMPIPLVNYNQHLTAIINYY